jgi:uncharacterized protein YcfJ
MGKKLIAGSVLGSILIAGVAGAVFYPDQGRSPQNQLFEIGGTLPTPVQLPVVSGSAGAEAPPEATAVVPPIAAPTAQQKFATVLDVQPIEERTATPRQECYQEVITHTAPAEDPHQVAGMLGGALLGGVLGHQVGDGRGKDLATVVGVAAGAYGGKKAQQRYQQSKTWTTKELRCETVTDVMVKIRGYDVSYEIDGKIATVRMANHPGKKVALRDGRPII